MDELGGRASLVLGGPAPMTTLGRAELEAMSREYFCEDLTVDFDAMTTWDQTDVKKFFESGGQVKPAAGAVASAPSVVDVADAVCAEAAVLDAKKRGSEKLSSGDLAGAVTAYREALDLCSPSLLASQGAALHSNLALATLKQGNAAASLAAASECVRLKPDWQKAHFRKGEALFELGRYADALASYREAQRISPNDFDVKRVVSLAEEAAKGGLWLRQLTPGRDIAVGPASQQEKLIFSVRCAERGDARTEKCSEECQLKSSPCALAYRVWQAAGQMQNFIYLIGDAVSRACYVVDACWDPKGVAGYAARHKMKLVGAIASHYHFDHVGGEVPPQLAAMVYGPFAGAAKNATLPGLAEMKTAHGCQLYAHSSEVARIAKQTRLPLTDLVGLDQGSSLPLGESGSLQVYHTPGHSGGSICLSVQPAGASASLGLIVGDTIFPGSCGRVRHAPANPRESARRLLRLITRRAMHSCRAARLA